MLGSLGGRNICLEGRPPFCPPPSCGPGTTMGTGKARTFPEVSPLPLLTSKSTVAATPLLVNKRSEATFHDFLLNLRLF